MTCWASQAADNHAAQEDEAEAWDAYVSRFVDDAADQLLTEDGNAAEMLNPCHDPDGTLEKLLLAVLDMDSRTPLNVRVAELREAMRAAVIAADLGVDKRAEKMAKAAASDEDEDAAATRMEARQAFDAMFPAFPSLRSAA